MRFLMRFYSQSIQYHPKKYKRKFIWKSIRRSSHYSRNIEIYGSPPTKSTRSSKKGDIQAEIRQETSKRIIFQLYAFYFHFIFYFSFIFAIPLLGCYTYNVFSH